MSGVVVTHATGTMSKRVQRMTTAARRGGSIVLGVTLLLVLVAFVPAARVQGPEVDVSRLPGPQTNPTITVDPRNDKVLLAASNSLFEGTERIYSSTDGGATWQSTTAFPPTSDVKATCASDPGVAIDRNGREYVSFVRATPCTSNGVYRVYVVSRSGPSASWSKPVLVAPLKTARVDDKPMIAVDASPVSPHRNRVYAAWSRLSRGTVFSIVVSHSDDGGKTWSAPVRANRTGNEVTYASVATSRKGLLYVAWTDISNFDVKIVRSVDGGAHFGPEQRVAAFTIVTIPHCGLGIVIPAEPKSCIQANPTVSIDTSGGRYSGRVYVSYTGTDFQGDQGASLTTFDRSLRPLAGYPLNRKNRAVAHSSSSPETRADQFWVQSAVDQSDGVLWVCYYDTVGDPERKRAHYDCTASRDGGKTWVKPIRAASADSDETQPGANYQYGYYQGLTAADGSAHPIWTDTRNLADLGEEIYTTTLTEADLGLPPSSR